MTEQKVTVGISGTEMLELGVRFGHAAIGGQCIVLIDNESLLGVDSNGHPVTSDGWKKGARLDLHTALKKKLDAVTDGSITKPFKTVGLAGKTLTVKGFSSSVGGSSKVSMVVDLWCALKQEDLKMNLVEGNGEAGTVEDVSADADTPGQFHLEIGFIRTSMVTDGPVYEDEQ